MDDLISRQAVLDILSCRNSAWDAYEKIVHLPSAQPSTQLIAEIKVSKEDMEKLLAEKVEAIKAELVQPKTGKWILDDEYIDCSVCRREKWSRFPYEDLVKRFRFCPNCGAKMEGEI